MGRESERRGQCQRSQLRRNYRMRKKGEIRRVLVWDRGMERERERETNRLRYSLSKAERESRLSVKKKRRLGMH